MLHAADIDVTIECSETPSVEEDLLAWLMSLRLDDEEEVPAEEAA